MELSATFAKHLADHEANLNKLLTGIVDDEQRIDLKQCLLALTVALSDVIAAIGMLNQKASSAASSAENPTL